MSPRREGRRSGRWRCDGLPYESPGCVSTQFRRPWALRLPVPLGTAAAAFPTGERNTSAATLRATFSSAPLTVPGCNYLFSQASVRPGDGRSKAASLWRGHKLSVTALALSSDDGTAWSASKDGKIFQWDVETGKRTQLPDRPPNTVQGVRFSTAANPPPRFLLPPATHLLLRVRCPICDSLRGVYAGPARAAQVRGARRSRSRRVVRRDAPRNRRERQARARVGRAGGETRAGEPRWPHRRL